MNILMIDRKCEGTRHVLSRSPILFCRYRSGRKGFAGRSGGQQSYHGSWSWAEVLRIACFGSLSLNSIC